MQKIMFNDRFLLTQAVLDGRKKQTRRIVKQKFINAYYSLVCAYETGYIDSLDDSIEEFLLEHSTYKVGEVVAVAQSYSSIVDYLQNPKNATCVEHFEVNFLKSSEILYEADGGKHKGFSNKMFVKPELMPYQIRITNVRVQRLQDITDEECLLEGVFVYHPDAGEDTIVSINDTKEEEGYRLFGTARSAYAFMIDTLSGKGTWDSNPYVFVYDFKLIK